MSAGNDPDKLAKLAASIQSVPIFVDCDPAFVESCSQLVRQKSEMFRVSLDLYTLPPSLPSSSSGPPSPHR